MNLDSRGVSYDDHTVEYETAGAYYDDDEPAAHAPSEFVARSNSEREARRHRDLTDLQDTWRAEQRERKREHAARFMPRPWER